jgi:hypothetical protein
MARINAYFDHTKEELPERCDLTFLVVTGAALERLVFSILQSKLQQFFGE